MECGCPGGQRLGEAGIGGLGVLGWEGAQGPGFRGLGARAWMPPRERPLGLGGEPPAPEGGPSPHRAEPSAPRRRDQQNRGGG